MGATPPDETDHCWGPTINWEACEAGHEETLRATWYRWAKDGSSVWGDIKDMSYEKTPMAYSDITTSLHNICTYNWSVQFLGFLTIPKDGNYTFDLQYTPYSGNVKSIAFIYFDPATSKSGTYTPGCNTSNYLILDGSWYGLTGNGGPFNLKAGKYPFVAWYSVNESKSTYDLKLKWKKPGDSSFTIIPKSQYNPADFISGTACNYYESKCSMDVPLR